LRLALLALVTASLGLAESAEEMLSSCKLLADAKVSNGQVTLPKDFESGRCWGAFGTFQDLARTSMPRPPALREEPVFGFCAPSSSTRTQYIAIFVEYARRNPKRLNEDFFDVALDALVDAFPCSPPCAFCLRRSR
jgi:Ssp1 endopeptidase immunity protein Rap1a